jgi:hypothetical protein
LAVVSRRAYPRELGLKKSEEDAWDPEDPRIQGWVGRSVGAAAWLSASDAVVEAKIVIKLRRWMRNQQR